MISIVILTHWRSFMSITSQLAKVIENTYKEKARLHYRIREIQLQCEYLDEQIRTFEKTLGYLDPEFDIRTIRTEFDRQHLIKASVFNQNVTYLLSQVLNKHGDWQKLSDIAYQVTSLDGQSDGYNREKQGVVGRALRKSIKIF